MILWGINALNHGSSLTVFSGENLAIHETCETDELDPRLIHRAFNYGGPCRVYWYERPLLKKLRQITAGQFDRAFDLSVLPKNYLKRINIKYAPITYTPHHGSHAAAGYYTSPFKDAAIIVLDAIGEFECASIWEGRGDRIRKVWGRDYPHSLGLFYSAFTDLIGLTPNRDESIFQAMADQGDPHRYFHEIKKYFHGTIILNYNFHKGVRNWQHEIKHDQDRYDIAAAVQAVFEEQLNCIMIEARTMIDSRNLVYMGGCAFNSKANRLIEDRWKNVWSLSNPGDASSSLGAVLYHTKQRVELRNDIAKHIQIKV
jgi:carbamoyltransferase